MNQIALPNLRGVEPATFLGALGVLSLVTHELGDCEATLCWPDGPQHAAVLGASSVSTIQSLSDELSGVARSMAENDELLPGAGKDFPPRRSGKSPDPTRSVALEAATVWARSARSRTAPRPWLVGIFATNDAVQPKDGAGPPLTVGRNPVFDAGPGTVSMSTTLATSRDASGEAGVVLDALIVGCRRPNSVGGYLDWRADRDAAERASRSDPSNIGDPVVAWLAFMGLRCAPLVAANGKVGSGLCPPGRFERYRKPLVWPVWVPALDFDAVSALVSHPLLDLGRLVSNADADDEKLSALGVCAVYASSRLSKGNNDGAYGPPVTVWSAS